MAMAGTLLEKDEEGVAYPETTSIRELYTALWGTAGPDRGFEMKRQSTSSVPIEEIWVPITTNEVVVKIVKMKANTTSGPDGVKKGPY